MADVNVEQHNSFMATPSVKSNAGDRKLCKKRNLSWLFGADRKDRFFYPHLIHMKDSYILLEVCHIVQFHFLPCLLAAWL